MFGRRKFGPGTLLKSSSGVFTYREDSGRIYSCKDSIYWDNHLEGKHYDWLMVVSDMGWVKRIEGKETIHTLPKSNVICCFGPREANLKEEAS